MDEPQKQLHIVHTWDGDTFHLGDIFRYCPNVESLVPNDYFDRDLKLAAIISANLGVFDAGYGEHPIFCFKHLKLKHRAALEPETAEPENNNGASQTTD